MDVHTAGLQTRTASNTVLAVQDRLPVLVNLQLGDDHVRRLHAQLDGLPCTYTMQRT